MNDPLEGTIAGEVEALKTKVAALEAEAQTWYEKHLPAILGFLGLALGFVLGKIHP